MKQRFKSLTTHDKVGLNPVLGLITLQYENIHKI